MVSIAESLNYRIFERKWRSGEALNGLPRACRILSVEQKPNNTKESWFVKNRFTSFSGDRVVTPSPRHNVDSWVIQFQIGPSVLFPDSSSRKGKVREPWNNKRNSLCVCKNETKNTLFVTDLSAAGSPAKLKHITQRRKRKQP